MKFTRVAIWFIALVLTLQTTAVFAAKAEAAGAKEIELYLNGSRIHTDTAPYIVPKAGKVMVPLRVIGESLGAFVDWNERSGTVSISGQDTAISLAKGKKTATVNGEPVELEASAEMRNGRTMVPLRFVGESLGMTVNWDEAARAVRLFAASAPSEPSVPSPSVPTPSKPDKPAGDEFRAAWVSTVYNIDWPTKAGLSAEQQQSEFTKLLDDLQDMGMNAAIVQVRPTSDAFYPSQYVPWSKYLTGVQGQDPGYDPLAFMIEETHKRNMEFHAWFNPFRISVDDKMENLAAEHPARQHPEWVVRHQGKLMYDPGIPAARDFIVDSIMEVVRNYDIDGVHLDDYFYPYGEDKEPFQDDAAYAEYNNGQFADKGDWRRHNVDLFVEQLSKKIAAVKSGIEFGISPFGVWRNQKMDPTGSNTAAGLSSYDNLYADVRNWIRSGWIDYVAPQIYWSLEHKTAPYATLVDWWANETKGTGVKLYIGHAPYKLGTSEAGWSSAAGLLSQLDYNRQIGGVSGTIFFSAKDLRKNTLGIADRLKTYYRQ
ncbi:hypothetical protein PAE9249_01067 [Paenibacillus sp. CECT 9249]|uniref:family 10 glycosylhydrolase n=1 Tax=Paenibacillus sp. CECT 9249 TaxID=2845385 RepID=UPI001E4E484B|nr:family 10 glycosylhydrolase [Paenibacillus sp. CECT 9249]CAH0118578.1 hypothetical protein PAE9249_01067 [Paenibacillus sp. CECT 9249]